MTIQIPTFRVALLGGAATIALSVAALPALAAKRLGREHHTGASTVGEVIVTARRISERLQDVPAAVSAVNEKQLDAIKPRNPEDLSGIAPTSISAAPRPGPGTSAI